MHPDIFTPGTCLFIVLLCCLTTNAPLTVKHIFEDNLNWAAFHLAEKGLRDIEINELNKMLSCKDESRGFFTYFITKANKWVPKCLSSYTRGVKMTFVCWNVEQAYGIYKNYWGIKVQKPLIYIPL